MPAGEWLNSVAAYRLLAFQKAELRWAPLSLRSYPIVRAPHPHRSVAPQAR